MARPGELEHGSETNKQTNTKKTSQAYFTLFFKEKKVLGIKAQTVFSDCDHIMKRK